MKLITLAELSSALAATRSRIAKIKLLSEYVRELEPDERTIGVAWLAGVLPGGRLGLGPAAVHALRDVTPAQESTLTLTDRGGAGVRERGGQRRIRVVGSYRFPVQLLHATDRPKPHPLRSKRSLA